MQTITFQEAPSGYIRGLLVIDQSTGHTEFRILLGYESIHEDDILTEYRPVFLGRDGVSSEPMVWHDALYTEPVYQWHPDGPLPSNGLVASGAHIKRGTIQWDHLVADLDFIRGELQGAARNDI
jgi:hypothetical protein